MLTIIEEIIQNNIIRIIMNINKAIIKALYEARKDDISAIKSFIEETKKIFHNKADVYLEDEYSDDPKVIIRLDEDCYQYWNNFVKKSPETPSSNSGTLYIALTP